MSRQPALDSDIAAIAQTEVLAAHAPWSEEAVRATLASDSGAGWVLRDAEGVVGHLLVQTMADEAEVLTIAVRPRARRQGHARTLLLGAREVWRAQGIRTAFLEVRADNHGAQALYEALGWATCGRRTAYYRDGTDAVVMQWTV